MEEYRAHGARFTILDPGSAELFERMRNDGRPPRTATAIAEWYERVMDGDHAEMRAEIVKRGGR